MTQVLAAQLLWDLLRRRNRLERQIGLPDRVRVRGGDIEASYHLQSWERSVTHVRPVEGSRTTRRHDLRKRAPASARPHRLEGPSLQPPVWSDHRLNARHRTR